MSEPRDDEVVESPAGDEEVPVEHVRITIKRRRSEQRLDKYVHGRFPNLSRSAIQKLIWDGAIRLNAKSTKPSQEIRAGDVIDVTLPAPEPTEVVPQDIPIDVLYEDDAIIAINKQAGIVCHPGYPSQTGTLVNALAFYADRLSGGSDPFRPGIVHRLDKNTTGLMLVAKTDEAHWRLARQFEQRTIQKTYLAVVHGRPQLDADTIDAPINIHPVVREKFAVLEAAGKINTGKQAVTRFEVAERLHDYTLMRLLPKTGRTHQLRVHMSHIGHPIVGDVMYGGKIVSESSLTGAGSGDPIFEHQALHAWKLEFTHPIRETPMALEAPFHTPFRRLMHILRSRMK